jgi:hypothetical protein
MYEDDLIALFERALRERDGELMWKALIPQPPAVSSDASNLFNDPNFVREIDHFIEKNRLNTGAVPNRYELQLALLELKAKKKRRPIRRFRIPLI